MDVPNGPDLKKWCIKDIQIYRKWLVGLLVGQLINLAKWAKIVISEWIWLKFSMDVPNDLLI
jgi:hypothetical protein